MSAPKSRSLSEQTDPEVGRFAAALRDRIGGERFNMWFARSVDWAVIRPDDGSAVRVQIIVAGAFALDRMRKNYIREIRAAAASMTPVPSIELVAADRRAADESPKSKPSKSKPSKSQPTGSTEPEIDSAAGQTGRGGPDVRAGRSAPTGGKRSGRSIPGSSRPVRRRGGTASLNELTAASIASASERRRTRRQASPIDTGDPIRSSDPISSGNPISSSDPIDLGDYSASLPAETTRSLSGGSAARSRGQGNATMDNFIVAGSSAMAHTAATMLCQQARGGGGSGVGNPASGSLVYVSGPSGVGKSHLLSGVADTLRRRYRMRGVVHVSAEQFTNEFVAVVGKSTIAAFRSRYRNVDALIIDDVHFVGGKKATIRELSQTIGAVAAAGRPILMAGLTTPHDTDGFTAELAGRMTSGLVCPLLPLCEDLRRQLLMRLVETRCPLAIDGEVLERIVPLLPGDGRMISGVANAIHLLQRMHSRSPDWNDVQKHCGHLLRAGSRDVDLRSIEQAVCELFNLESGSLRSGSQSRRVSQPRMLAMYLSRQKTSSAYSEIAKHFNIRSHTTAMAAERNVEKWIDGGTAIGRGPSAMAASEALQRVEGLLRQRA